MSDDPLFDQAIAVVLGHEGGLSLNKGDPGNWTGGKVGAGALKGTNFGISAASYPALNIVGLTRDDAIAIYLRDFWLPHRWRDMPGPIAIKAFDASLNMGAPSAVTCLQRACWAAGGTRLTEDGELGSLTIAAASKPSVASVLAALKSELAAHYRMIAQAQPTQAAFLPGWLARAYS